MASEPSDSTVWGAGAEVQIPGPKGDPGPAGPPPNLTKGSVSSGIDADFTIRGASPNYIIDMVLPEGPQGSPGAPGSPGQFVAVHVTTLPPGSPATAGISGPSSAQILELGIPRGNSGEDGDPGPVGPAGPISSINNTGNGIPVFTGMSGDEGEEANFQGITNSPTIKASQVNTEDAQGVSLRYTPSYGIVQRSQDLTVTSPAEIAWQTVSGPRTSIFNAATPNHVTMPASVTQLELLAQVEVTRNAPDSQELLTVEVLRNGNPVNPSVKVQTTNNLVSLFSRVLNIAPGDSISLRVTASDLETIVASGTWMEAMLY